MVVSDDLNASDRGQRILANSFQVKNLASFIDKFNSSSLIEVTVNEEQHHTCPEPLVVHPLEVLEGEFLKKLFELATLETLVKDNSVEVGCGQSESLVKVKVLHFLQRLLLYLVEDTLEVRAAAHLHNALERLLNVDGQRVGVARPVELKVIDCEGDAEVKLGTVCHILELTDIFSEDAFPDLSEDARVLSYSKVQVTSVDFDCDVTLRPQEMVILLKPELRVVPLLREDRLG